ncbi:hypothetical protein Moror_3484 [Moniliophthora roreri MCA 2997]|uniref:Uncharacterized protein n=1 Tax=Moniliophthora roreri (strain MCA 2997) TaxID=1381753 RepID=V2WNP0_MONRO|nr:hypothetical protein Moror_3484 [Moniliophthora roreri MCA 2997]
MASSVSGWNQMAGSFDKGVKGRDSLESVLDFRFNVRIGSGFRIKEGVVGSRFGVHRPSQLRTLKVFRLGYLEAAWGSAGEAWIGADVTSIEDLISDFKVATLSDLGE